MPRRSHDARSLWIEHGIDVEGRTINLLGDVDEALTDRLLSGLHLMDGDRPINILLQTYGGSIDEMFAIYDAIRQEQREITITVSGYACSAGCVILQAADRRLVRPNAFIMHHVGQGAMGYQHPKNLFNAVDLYKKQLKAMEIILLGRVREKKPDISEAVFRNRHDWDIFLSASEAVAWGLADEVVE